MINQILPLPCRNCQLIPFANIPIMTNEEFSESIAETVRRGERLLALFAQSDDSSRLRLFALTTFQATGELHLWSTFVGDRYPALTPKCAQAHLFEREIAENWGIVPEGHPWLKPVRFTSAPIGVMDFFQVAGTDIHEVAVGPVHAGVIEPGHFRFSCSGEQVVHLEISLGYQHRGVEAALKGGPSVRTIHYMETIAGDTTIGHATAYCQNVETLSRTQVSLRAMVFRGIALELERLANHTGDLGALAGDVGYLPVASHCGRIRGDFLNLTAQLCGNRLGRGLVRPGGVAFDLDEQGIVELQQKLDRAFVDVSQAVQLLWDAPSVLDRFENTGPLGAVQCRELGVVGPPARAAGLDLDTRLDYPSDIYRFAQIPVTRWHTGDVFGRAYVRWLEIVRSVEFIRARLNELHPEPVRTATSSLCGNALSISLVEAWRGEICHIACVGEDRRFKWYKIVDPSFHNWMGLAMAMRDQQISDFPLCNKSFNLSYCGHDL